MKRVSKYFSFFMILVFMFITCAGCFNDSSSDATQYNGPVDLVSMPASSTVRLMDESLYIGYLGAQRDFALIVDNASKMTDDHVQGCGYGEIGCASIMTQLVMTYGIKTTNFIKESSDNNLLIYYVTSLEFDKFGGNSGGWYDLLTGRNNTEYSEISKDDNVLKNSCGSNVDDKAVFCKYSKEMTENGYSTTAGSSMLLLFESGKLYSIVTDNDLDRIGELNEGNFDSLNFNIRQPGWEEKSAKLNNYYKKLINSFKGKITVSHATNSSQKDSESQSIQVLDTLEELENKVNSNEDFLLLITSDGFIDTKVGNDYFHKISYGDDGKFSLEETTDNKELKVSDDVQQNFLNTLMLLFNNASVYLDNCAVESDELLNFLKEIIQTMVTGIATGAYIGALVGSFIPGIGTAVGAVVGAGIGALVSIFSNYGNNGLDDRLKSNNEISEKSYCKIVESALNGIEINVPIYTYKIKSATKNIENYVNGSMSDSKLKKYYDDHRDTCLTQSFKVAVPAGLLSLVTTKFDPEYNYADTCEEKSVSEIVRGFGGSPSLQLYLNGKKVDDLNGRVTSELVNEMMSVWGLKSKGGLYTLKQSTTLNGMTINLGSAQQIQNVSYCITTSTTPSCDGKDKTSLSLNSTYVGAYKEEDSISLDFTDEYKKISIAKTNELLTEDNISDMGIYGDHKKYSYRQINGDSDSWSVTEYSDTDSATAAFDEILLDVRTALRNRSENAYQVSYRGVNYIIDGNRVYGYILKDSKMNLVYYSNDSSDGAEYLRNNEYIFGDLTESPTNNYYHHALRANNVNVQSAHDFYVYIEYNYKENPKENPMYYSYVM